MLQKFESQSHSLKFNGVNLQGLSTFTQRFLRLATQICSVQSDPVRSRKAGPVATIPLDKQCATERGRGLL